VAIPARKSGSPIENIPRKPTINKIAVAGQSRSIRRLPVASEPAAARTAPRAMVAAMRATWRHSFGVSSRLIK
jgi:hypothetical protein